MFKKRRITKPSFLHTEWGKSLWFCKRNFRFTNHFRCPGKYTGMYKNKNRLYNFDKFLSMSIKDNRGQIRGQIVQINLAWIILRRKKSERTVGGMSWLHSSECIWNINEIQISMWMSLWMCAGIVLFALALKCTSTLMNSVRFVPQNICLFPTTWEFGHIFIRNKYC